MGEAVALREMATDAFDAKCKAKMAKKAKWLKENLERKKGRALRHDEDEVSLLKMQQSMLGISWKKHVVRFHYAGDDSWVLLFSRPNAKIEQYQQQIASLNSNLRTMMGSVQEDFVVRVVSCRVA